MATLDVVTTGKGKKSAGKVELAAVVFDVPLKPHLLHAEVRRQLAARRSGTSSSKNRSAVSGGGAKPWRQKGTGRARQGSTRSPQWAGGGVAFGPVPRSYRHRLPKKVRRAALCGALSQRLREEAITVVEELELGEFKTKGLLDLLHTLGFQDESLLIVIDGINLHLELSARNLHNVSVLRSEGLNVYDLLRHEKVLLTRKSLASLEARLGGASGDES